MNAEMFYPALGGPQGFVVHRFLEDVDHHTPDLLWSQVQREDDTDFEFAIDLSDNNIVKVPAYGCNSINVTNPQHTRINGISVFSPVNQAFFNEAHEHLRRTVLEKRRMDGLRDDSYISICQVLKNLPPDTTLYCDRIIGLASQKCAYHLCWTPTSGHFCFSELNERAKVNRPRTSAGEKTDYWQVCWRCASETIEDFPAPNLPDERFLLHAAKSLDLIVDDPKFSLSFRFMIRLYQHVLDVGDNLEWEQLSKWQDRVFFKILLISLPMYQKGIKPSFNWEIVDMLSDVNHWLATLLEVDIIPGLTSPIFEQAEDN